MRRLLDLLHSLKPRDERRRGILYVVIAMFFFSIMAAISKHMTESYSIFEVVFFRCFFAALPLIPFILYQGGFAVFKTKNIPGHAMRSLSGAGSMALYFYSLHLLPLADAIAISFSGALFITTLSALLLKESVGAYRWGAVIVGFIGVIFIAQPQGLTLNSNILIGLGSALLYGFAMVSLRKLGRTEKALTTTAYFTLFSTLLAAIPAALDWKGPGAGDLFLFAASGIFAGIGQLLLTRAYQLTSPSALSPFNYTAIIWATLLGFFFWGYLPNMWVWIGSAIVIASGLFILHRENTKKVPPLPETSPLSGP